MNRGHRLSFRILVMLCLAIMFLFAFSVSIIGLVLPSVIAEFQISLSQAGIVTVAQNAGGIVALAVCGYLADKVGKQRVILVLFGAMTAALLVCRITRSYAGFVVIAMILGLAASTLNMCISAYLADLFPDKQQFYVNLGGVLFGFGSVLGPIYAEGMSRNGTSWRDLFLGIGIMSLVVFIPTVIAIWKEQRQRKEQKTSKRKAEAIKAKELLENPGLWYFVVVGFLYMAHSSAFMGWIPTYLSMTQTEKSIGNSSLMTIYWISILAGRVLATFTAERLKYKSYMIVSNLLGGLAMLGCLGVQGRGLSVLFIIIGISTGAVFQICLAETCKTFPQLSGTASSIVALFASIGGTLACYLTGVLAESLGFSAAILLLSVSLLLIPVVILLKGDRKNENGSYRTCDR